MSSSTLGDNFPALMAATEQLAPLIEEDAKRPNGYSGKPTA